ncbi:MAG TPA: ribulose-phosphate 3-epimerase [Bacillota bacterium]
MPEIAPSILNADLVNLKNAVAQIKQADWLHFDVMDGHFVPNLTFGPMFVGAIRKVSELPVEAHLMVENPEFFIPLYAAEGSRRLIIHAETTQHLHRIVQQIKESGCEAGIALNPATPLNCVDYILADLDLVLLMTVNPGYGGQKLIPEVIPKIRELRRKIDTIGLACKIEVDGGVNWENASVLLDAGVDILVAGSLIYHDPDPTGALERLQGICRINR